MLKIFDLIEIILNSHVTPLQIWLQNLFGIKLSWKAHDNRSILYS